ncbi:sulfatase-like hydrolase/transferase [Streptomyces sp. 3MP-14]|uniref:Sulfatase-like hydrolase/transferase n=1 Tax=Streptomyces mimosae TaxID=2586635 RepID=A0A5N6A7A6_9ACTN|nr:MULTISPECIES: sulfatase-like hydrolase/transferase [Streptomyces]KAB8164664.1 sulfatase-like hydrolase/transferase [Streptomyces mimosae]KAB8175580.1 sulfatase-like hydrolase/transferase [Streptomyces sp. 3MP-14]
MNVLFLMTDQHRVDTLGCYGNPTVATPHLDRLAASGTRFDRFYTPTAICTPARASLLTGQAPFRHRLLANQERNVGYLEDLSDDVFTFPAALAERGYQLGLVGKWHGGTERNAASYGFAGPDLPGWHNPVDHPDYLAYLAERGLPGYRISEPIRGTTPNGNPGNLLAARLHQPVEATFEHYLATRAIEMLERFAADGRPFYLATHFFGPHLPYLLPDAYYDRYDPDRVPLPPSVAETFEGKPPVQRNYSAHWTFDTLPTEVSRKLIAVYWGYVTLIDEQIGRILTRMDELGLADETSVFFTADHGEFTGAHRLHDKGPAMYEDIYRIPGILRVPGGPPQTRNELVSLTDCTATILELAGADPTPATDSRSLLPLARGEHPDWPGELLAEFHGHHFPYPQRMILDDRYKLVVNPESVNELYDLHADPHELTNRYEDPELRAERRRLVRRLYDLLRERGDNFYHWMTPMYDIGELDHDPTLSAFEPEGPAAP